MAVAGHHADLAHPLAQRQGRLQHRRRGLRAAHDLQQPHDVRRAEEVQAEHLTRTRGDRGDGVDVQVGGIAGQHRGGLQRRVQLAEDRLLEFQVLVDRLDHQVRLAHRGEVLDRRDAGAARGRFLFADAPLAHVVRVGVGHGAERLVEHLRVAVQPLHVETGVGQAHDDTATHGAGADHRGLAEGKVLAHGLVLVVASAGGTVDETWGSPTAQKRPLP